MNLSDEKFPLVVFFLPVPINDDRTIGYDFWGRENFKINYERARQVYSTPIGGEAEILKFKSIIKNMEYLINIVRYKLP